MKNDLYFAKHEDNRGYHMKFFTKETANKFNFLDVAEVFMTSNNRGTLRGLHRQTGDYPQQKIIKVLNGEFNVRIIYPNDINSKIYDKNCTMVDETESHDKIVYFDGMNSDSNPVLVPKNALLSYVALQDDSKMLYIADNPFVGEADEGFNALDPRFSIEWGINENELIRNERDSDSSNY